MHKNMNALPSYFKLQGEQHFITENYVSTPPALMVLDETGAVWALGMQQVTGPRGEYAFDVLRDGQPTGEFASRIERRGGKVRIFTVSGWKNWTGRMFV
jgi:hypothetical protein